MSVTPDTWSESVKAYFRGLGWHEGRHIDLTDLLVQTSQHGWTCFPAAQSFLESVEGLGQSDSKLFSCLAGPESHWQVFEVERAIGKSVFPVGAEDGWMVSLIDSDGQFYVCDLPYTLYVYDSLELFISGKHSFEKTLRVPSPDLIEWNRLCFEMVVFLFERGDSNSAKYLEMQQRKHWLGLRIFRFDHRGSSFKTDLGHPFSISGSSLPDRN